MEKFDRRTQKRIPKRYPIQYGVNEPSHLGFIMDLSHGGLKLAGQVIFPPPTRLKMVIRGDNTPISLAGQVRWSDRAQPHAITAPRLKMGVIFLNESDEYIHFLEDLIRAFKELRRETRLEKEFKVTFKSRNELMIEYAQNISQGGIFITTDRPAELNSIISVNMFLIDLSDVIRAEGRVVHILPKDQAERFGGKPGMGVQFIRFEPDDETRLKNYIAMLTQT